MLAEVQEADKAVIIPLILLEDTNDAVKASEELIELDAQDALVAIINPAILLDKI